MNRIHPWPNAKNLNFRRYLRAITLASRLCYSKRYGWLPWSTLVVPLLYRFVGPQPVKNRSK